MNYSQGAQKSPYLIFIASLSCRGRPSEILSSHSLGAVVILCISSIHPRAFIRHRRRHASSPSASRSAAKYKCLYHQQTSSQSASFFLLQVIFIVIQVLRTVLIPGRRVVVPYKEEVNFVVFGQFHQNNRIINTRQPQCATGYCFFLLLFFYYIGNCSYLIFIASLSCRGRRPLSTVRL